MQYYCAVLWTTLFPQSSCTIVTVDHRDYVSLFCVKEFQSIDMHTMFRDIKQTHISELFTHRPLRIYTATDLKGSCIYALRLDTSCQDITMIPLKEARILCAKWLCCPVNQITPDIKIVYIIFCHGYSRVHKLTLGRTVPANNQHNLHQLWISMNTHRQNYTSFMWKMMGINPSFYSIMHIHAIQMQSMHIW